MTEINKAIKIESSVDFRDILNLLYEYNKKIIVSIKMIEAVGVLRSGESIISLENRIQNSNEGVDYNLQQLKELAEGP